MRFCNLILFGFSFFLCLLLFFFLLLPLSLLVRVFFSVLFTCLFLYKMSPPFPQPLLPALVLICFVLVKKSFFSFSFCSTIIIIIIIIIFSIYATSFMFYVLPLFPPCLFIDFGMFRYVLLTVMTILPFVCSLRFHLFRGTPLLVD